MQTHQPEHQGLDRWTTAMQSICGRFETQLACNPSLFIGDVCAQTRAGLPVASLRTNAGVIRRLGSNPDVDDDQHCFLVLQRSGHATVEQAGLTIQLAPGDLMLMDSVGRCEIKPAGLIEHVSLALSRDQVCKHVTGRDCLVGKISSSNACGRMLHALMDQLCKDERGDQDSSQGAALQAAFTALLEPGLELGEGSRYGVEALGSQNLRSYVQKMIDQSLSQPGLTPASLAGGLNISVRHLYRLFEEDGDSVCRYIQRTRLTRSAEDLANPFFKRESITAIAYKWGFTDSAHFSRSFKKQFDQSPKDYRATAMGLAMR
ncbi:transcriptional regulator FeaR [Pseudomonas sp. S60]|uniref:transcriptional regulator FeaR n=1 Tax=unclassified Pseudomonas TaxID=196821 RepID=UPI0019147D50|nr:MULTISPECIES: transcriptional regulator FeaR [unclassified Pseudomonas]MBK5007750.1 transcriptional regulator FeaR [Pseudomonas sp. S32]MBK5012685.1 transcriptional regulator FeaR [Pseudomonas sp. S60]